MSKIKAKSKAKTRKASKSVEVADLVRIYVRSDKAIFRSDESGDVLVMLINNPDSFFRIDAWAARVWSLIDGSTSVQGIAKKIVAESKFDQDFVVKNVLSVLKDFVEYEIIKLVGGK